MLTRNSGAGTGEARITIELDGHTYSARALAIGPESVLQRLSETFPKLSSALGSTLKRQLAAEKKNAAGADPTAS